MPEPHRTESQSKPHPLTGRPKTPEHARKVAEALRARKANPELLAQCIERYKGGAKADDLAAKLNINRSTFLKWLRREGVQTRSLSESIQLRYTHMSEADRQSITAAAHAATRFDVPQVFVDRYVAGEDAHALAREAGIHYETLLKRLQENNAVRSSSENHKLRWQKMTPEKRAAAVERWAATRRGKKDPYERRCRRAATRERERTNEWPSERRFAKLLAARGVVTVPQKACGPFNIDLAIEQARIAIELVSSWNAALIRRDPENGPPDGSPRRERVEHLVDAGWHVVEVWMSNANVNTTGAADFILELSGLSLTSRRHLVITGNGRRLRQYELAL